jgi:KDEL-tailed cysteine endopeptidase
MANKTLAIVAFAATVGLLAIYGTESLPSSSSSSSLSSAPKFSFLSSVADDVEPHIVAAFRKWSSQHNKMYASDGETAYRLKVFRDNFLFIQRHTSEKHSYTLTLNRFADLTNEEFRATHTSLKAELRDTYDPVYLNTSDVPSSVDWREKGIVAPVKDQKQCGSCWAFSAIAALEGLYAQKNGNLQTFSEQQLVDCSRPQGNLGCNGGLMDSAFKYVKQHGIQTEDQYPYTARDGKCHDSSPAPSFTINGYKDVPQNDNDQLAAAVAQGVISVAIEADTEVFQFYNSGVIDSADCGTQLDHGVVVVGFGTTDTGIDYWLVRNSWGSIWGDNGYVKILRQKGRSSGVCGIAKMASYPTL